MRTLPATFTKKGFEHKIVERSGLVATVERKHRDVSIPHWEVVRLRVRPSRPFPGSTATETTEVYPASEEWGKLGWTYKDIESAKAKFIELTKLCQSS